MDRSTKWLVYFGFPMLATLAASAFAYNHYHAAEIAAKEARAKDAAAAQAKWDHQCHEDINYNSLAPTGAEQIVICPRGVKPGKNLHGAVYILEDIPSRNNDPLNGFRPMPSRERAIGAEEPER